MLTLGPSAIFISHQQDRCSALQFEEAAHPTVRCLLSLLVGFHDVGPVGIETSETNRKQTVLLLFTYSAPKGRNIVAVHRTRITTTLQEPSKLLDVFNGLKRSVTTDPDAVQRHRTMSPQNLLQKPQTLHPASSLILLH